MHKSQIFSNFTKGKPQTDDKKTKDMFIPFDIVVLLILSPFIILLWVVMKIVKLLVRLAFYIVKVALKLSMRLLCRLFLEVKRLLTA